MCPLTEISCQKLNKSSVNSKVRKLKVREIIRERAFTNQINSRREIHKNKVTQKEFRVQTKH